MIDKIRAKMGARSPRSVLVELAEGGLFAQLLLHNGHTLSGEVVNFGSEGREEFVLLLTERAQQAVYLPVSAVCSVTLAVTEQSLPVLTQGKVGKVSELSGVSRLAFRRRVAELQGQMEDRFGRRVALECDQDLEGETERLPSALAVVEAIVEVLLSLDEDELGREALTAIDGVRFSWGESAGVDLESKFVRVTLNDLSVGDRAAWRTLLEAAL